MTCSLSSLGSFASCCRTGALGCWIIVFSKKLFMRAFTDNHFRLLSSVKCYIPVTFQFSHYPCARATLHMQGEQSRNYSQKYCIMLYHNIYIYIYILYWYILYYIVLIHTCFVLYYDIYNYNILYCYSHNNILMINYHMDRITVRTR